MSGDLESIIATLRDRRKTLKFNDLRSLMDRAGCEAKPTREGCMFRHDLVPGMQVPIAKPHGRSGGNDVREPYVKQCIKLLEELRDNLGESNRGER